MAKAVRGVRKYSASELKNWMQLPLAVVRRTSMKDPLGEEPAPFDHIRIVAMHHMKDRRNQPDRIWLDRHVSIHAKLARGLPAVTPGDVPVEELVDRFKNGESPASIAAELALEVDAVASALAWAQRTAPSKAAAWTKKKIATKASPKPVTLHGRALVEAVIASVREGKNEKPTAPMSAAIIGDLDLDGVALPASLATWLAFSTSRVACAKKSGLTASTLREVMAKVGYRWEHAGLEAALPSSCYVLEVGDTQVTFLYAGVTEAGELPIFTIDVDGMPSAWISFPGFDVYVASRTDYLALSDDDDLPRPYQARVKAHAKHFGGNKAIEPSA